MYEIILKAVPAYASLLLSALLSRQPMADGLRTWYPKLKRPPFAPPRWAFPVAWNIIYICMALSYGFIQSDKTEKQRLYTLWWIQPILMWLWTMSFFGFKRPRLAILIILSMIITSAAYILLSWRTQQTKTAFLMAPYTLWLHFALYLNISYTVINDI